jgi:hypothetical protein
MKIKKINEWDENTNLNIDMNNEKIQNLKKLLEQVYEDGADNVTYTDEEGYETLSFTKYWRQYGDRLILDSGILDIFNIDNEDVEK